MASAEQLAEIKKNMTYVRLGKSGLTVSRLILGTMSYGTPEWQKWVLPESDGLEHFKIAYDAGINAFDTANVYSNGESERIVGNAIKKYNFPREEIVVLTKVFFPVGPTPSWMGLGKTPAQLDAERMTNQYGLSRKHIFASVKASLERLQLDYIDVLQCHRFDPDTPIEETMQALHDVVQAGYVRYIGMSSCKTYQFHIMQNYAITHNLTPFITMQNHYNAVYREEEREMMPTLKHFGVSSIPWSPLARGLLTRPYDTKSSTTRGETDRLMKAYTASPGTPKINARIAEVADQKGVSMAQVAIAWALSKDGVHAPIVGSTSVKHLLDILGGVNVTLTEEEIKSIEEPYEAQAYIGHT